MTRFVVRPAEHRQFGDAGDRRSTFCLLTQADRVDDFDLSPTDMYASEVVVGLERGESLASALTDNHCPADADVLVVCPDMFVVSPSAEEIGPTRRLAVMPCGSTPVTDDHVEYFLAVAERTDPSDVEERCARLFAAFEESSSVALEDARHGAEATFSPWGDYEWNQQAGVLEPGEQQVIPSGEASALPTDITEFDGSRRLGLAGTVALRGRPIVHRGDQPDTVSDQARLFADLDTVSEAAVLIDVADGLVTECRPSNPAAKPAAEALASLFARDDNYRIVWEFGIGVNSALVPQPGNCGMNEMFGSDRGILHLGFGLTPTTTYALTFACADTTLRSAAGQHVAGPTVRRLNRRRSADCGCG